MDGMQPVLDALDDQRRELDMLLSGLDDHGWSTPTPRCPGWTVADVVLHLAQSDEMAIASAEGTFAGFLAARGGGSEVGNVDDAAASAVGAERGQTTAVLHERWRASAAAQHASLAACDPSQRLTWVAGELAAQTLTTTRLAECWIHSGDIADAVGADLEPTDRLWHIARLAWRTLPYAFHRAGRSLAGPVAVSLYAPDKTTWEFGEKAAAATIVEGPAEEFCLVAGRRLMPDATSLIAEGADAEAVVELIRTFA
jgi:uncharacterized protein (TIGR03084 family)